MKKEEVDERITAQYGPGYYSVRTISGMTGLSPYSIKRWVNQGMLTDVTVMELGNSKGRSYTYVFNDSHVAAIFEIMNLSPRGRREKGLR